jgi:hypothetical protein
MFCCIGANRVFVVSGIDSKYGFKSVNFMNSRYSKFQPALGQTMLYIIDMT